MRIQHNITAMNSYRNFSANNKNLAGNLEKLSSGYRINRAGDDAAGLAISEKMRAQITGLEGAKKNATDGISLIQTAEGALTEVHDMLNRMTTLAEQSANGTYQNELDREQLQKEVDALKSEIDRIADSTNFNGLKLLDGSLAGTNTANAVKYDTAMEVVGKEGIVTAGTATALTSTVTFAGTLGLATGDKFSITLELADGQTFSYDLEMVSGTKVSYNGETLDAAVATDAGTVSAIDIATVLTELVTKDDRLNEIYTATNGSTATATMTLTSIEKDFAIPGIKVVSYAKSGAASTNVAGATTAGEGAHSVLNFSNMVVYDASSADKKVSNSVITVDGQKFAFVKDDASAKELGSDVNVIIATAGNTNGATDASKMVQLMNQKLGSNLPTTGINTSAYKMITKGGYDSGNGKGLTLQIGDTADSFNKLTVSVGDMHSSAIGIGDVDISTQSGAAAALDKIKQAVNNVSDTRGTLGALQNRLDHTINNLGVMQENIQSAESNIRDTDVADEMMKYTKNNILNQSAQAMLAQANQLPQGVLQLLQ